MFAVQCDDLNQAVCQTLEMLMKSGDVIRIEGKPEGFAETRELHPCYIQIDNPNRRVLSLHSRKANIVATIAETLWVLFGDNDISQIEPFMPRASNFSDDGKTWRAFYGERLFNWQSTELNQFHYCYETLNKDIFSRQAVMSLWDPNRECTVGNSRDYPCSNHVQFLYRNGALDLTLTMRSNDCFSGDTVIPLMNGEKWTLKDLADKKANEEFWVYSRNKEGRIVAGKAHHPRKTKTVSSYVIVTLDNDEKIKCTKDHRFMLLDGSYKPAGELTEHDRLSPNDKLERLLSDSIAISVEHVEEELDVYDITVDDHHNFALESGVFVHNCLWGFSHINMFEFSVMQEIMAKMLGVPVGRYYHQVGSFHIYECMYDRANEIINNNNPKEYTNLDHSCIQNVDNLKPLFSVVTKSRSFKEVYQEVKDGLKSSGRTRSLPTELCWLICLAFQGENKHEKVEAGRIINSVMHPDELSSFYKSDYSFALALSLGFKTAAELKESVNA